MSSMTPVDETPLEDQAQMVGFILAGAKPRERWVIGTEHEKLGWSLGRGSYPTFEGPDGIGALLERMSREAGWVATREGEAIIALARDGATITLEPGGQFELSGAPLRWLADTERELDEHLAELAHFSAPLGLIWSGVGLAPTLTGAEMPRMPKARYGIMRRYLPTRGDLALYMMHSTCTVQANYDFSDAEDAMRKLRLALRLQPMVTAAFANSPVLHGELVPERSYRARIWERTDPDRVVWPRRLLDEDSTLADYVEWVLDVPMFFIHRDGAYLDCAGLPLRRFISEGYQGHRATLGDFALHLSTIFPDARLKQYLEVRGADMGSRAQVLALPAFHAGLLYDEEAMARAEAAVADLDYDRWWSLRSIVATDGLHAPDGSGTLRTRALTLVDLAMEGLSRREPGAVRLLEPLRDAVAAGRCPADDLRAAWDGDAAALMLRTRIA